MNEDIAREIAKDIYKKEHGDNDPEFWVCGQNKLNCSDEATCECGATIYFDREMVKNFKNPVKICIKCALKKDLTFQPRSLHSETSCLGCR